MKRYLILFCLFFFEKNSKAQFVFVENAKITFEKKYNNKMANSESTWMSDEMKSQIPKFLISYWEFSFNDSTSIYRVKEKNFNESDNRISFGSTKNNSEMYTQLTENKRVFRKNIMGDDFIFEDTIPKVNWKIVDEVRKIAGYECRKAIGVINKDIYVIAFFTDEILMRGGPEGFTGLPGLILGLAIPQSYTTWFATKVEYVNVPLEDIKPPSKGKKTSSEKEWKKFIDSIRNYYKKDKNIDEKKIKKDYFGFLL